MDSSGAVLSALDLQASKGRMAAIKPSVINPVAGYDSGGCPRSAAVQALHFRGSETFHVTYAGAFCRHTSEIPGSDFGHLISGVANSVGCMERVFLQCYVQILAATRMMACSFIHLVHSLPHFARSF